ncbi:PTS sugar transporter subunit IIB [Selenomonas ruminantium]|uniref:PTS sugar transporter subunit IIB n=1 Tax=Selenomonas ruminantium TaxID=971 RepID=UPI001569AFEF|nr:PTS sugar transporter subunit IIB [Selenomonas ruminantium]
MRKIILLCSAGMSTSMLVKKMKEAAAADNYACEIEAFPMSEAKAKASDADIIFLGPQVRFSKDKVAEQCPGRPVEVIDMKLYGRMDGKGVIARAKQALGD